MAASSSCKVSILIFVGLCVAKSNAKTFLRGEVASSFSNYSKSVEEFNNEVRAGVTSALGCGKPVADSEVLSTKRMLAPLWQTLHQNSYGNVDRHALRYIAHRYFARRFNIWVRGFEPTRVVNESSMDVAEILGQKLPRYVEAVLKSHHGAKHGFSIDDAVYMLIMIQQIILDSESALLEHVYMELGKSMGLSLGHREVHDVLHSYFFHWLIGEDIHAGSNLAMLHNLTRVEIAASPLNAELLDFMDFVDGQIRTMHWLRSQKPLPGDVGSFWRNQYSFSDVHKIATGITKSFGFYWASDCQTMKKTLVHMDPRGMGRVPISKFYAATVEGTPRFAESSNYLRELGALDETSLFLGKQVIIPNYLQAASNCLVSVSHYRICCSNDCEHVLGEIELSLGSPSASPLAILEVVKNMTTSSPFPSWGNDEFDDEPVALERALVDQLHDIASTNAGKVELHGRLFSQWLHYVFPRDCPFPHKTGTVSHATPREYGNASVMSLNHLQAHHHATDPLETFASDTLSTMDRDDLQWMSQWSSEEELISDIGQSLERTHSTTKHDHFLFVGALVMLFGGAANIASNYLCLCFRASVMNDQHAHYV